MLHLPCLRLTRPLFVETNDSAAQNSTDANSGIFPTAHKCFGQAVPSNDLCDSDDGHWPVARTAV